MTNLVGQVIDHYQIVEHLGDGGMAYVYKAYHPGLDVYRAIKIIRPEFADQPGFKERFQREAQAVAKLRHPNIVQIHDYGAHDKLYYMVMEFIEGQDLKDYLKQYGAIRPFSQVVSILVQIAAALNYAHGQGVLHRDIKPANIMLTPRQEVILTDFGIAKILQQTNPKGPMTEVGVSIGTPAYMAPEQAQGLPDIGPTADIYSLGIVLYEMLTGRVPYIADTPLAVILKVINDPLPPPRAFSSDIPDTLQRVVLKATAKNPADRYPTAEALADGLKRSLSADPGTGVNISEATVIATAPPAKRRPPFLWLGLGFIILLLGLTALCGIILGPTIITALQRETPAPVATLGTAATSMPQTPSSTLSPTPTIPLASSATDTGTLIVFDDFDNPEFDGKWNEEIWTHDPEDSATIEQADGSLKLSRQTAQSSGLDYEPLTIGEIGFIEAALKLQDNIRASAGNVSIVISHEDWWLGCFVSGGSQEDDALASCDTSDNYAANGVTVPYNSWHTLRFEVDPTNAAVSFFVDGTHIGRYTPPDPEAFKQTQVAFTLAVWSEDGGLVTGYIDEVKVGQ